MLSAIVVGWTQPLWNYVRNICTELNDVWIYKTIESPSSVYEISRAMTAYETEVIFLEIDGDGETGAIRTAVQQIQSQSPETGIVPVCRMLSEDAQRLAAELGLQGPLTPPFTTAQLEAALLSTLRPASQHAGKLMLFMPSRPGSGATTIGLNTAYALARSEDDSVAFVEFDEYAGTIASMLPAAESAPPEPNPSLNRYSWKRYVQSINGVDFIPGAMAAALTGTDRWAVKRLADIARSHNEWVIAQIPRVSDPRTQVLMHQVAKLCLVSSADAAGLALTRRRIAELESMGLDERKIHVVLNRSCEPYSAGAFEKALGRDVAAVFPYDAEAIGEAQARSQGLVNRNCAFGREVQRLAARLHGKLEVAEAGKRRFAFWSRMLTPQYKVAS